jgi:hypothetical protein
MRAVKSTANISGEKYSLALLGVVGFAQNKDDSLWFGIFPVALDTLSVCLYNKAVLYVFSPHE